MKRLLSLTLAAALLGALALPASAAEDLSQDARLAQVTALVKKTLDLDTEAYENFRGDLSEDLARVWNLSWESENRSLSVSALEDGTVVRLHRWAYDPSPDAARFPAFPEEARAVDRAAAGDFLSRVLRPGETVELEDGEGGIPSLSGSGGWSGTIVLNGLPSSLHYSVSVENGVVDHFSRDVTETAAVGGVPSPEAPASRDKAEVNLKNTLGLNLEYVWNDAGDKAVLRYVPEATHEFLVDAKTEEFLDLTELKEKLGTPEAPREAKFANTAAGAEDAAAEEESGLTLAELEGVQKLEGVLPYRELDETLRAESAYGLGGYALASYVYNPWSNDDGRSGVDCELRYTKTDGEERLRRNITVDAKTGEVRAVWSSAPYGRGAKLTRDQAQEKAEAYLKVLCPDRDLALYRAGEDQAVPLKDMRDPSYPFRFARQENGIFFPANLYEVSIDAADGSVYGLSVTWDEDVTFQDPKGVIFAETALAAWRGTYQTVLAYRNVPRKLNKADPVQARLMEQGMEYYYALRLTYGLEREEACGGVDAMTGELIQASRGSSREPLRYTDLGGSPAKADIEKLAEYGVGFRTDKFRPGRTITQWELVALVSSLRGAPLDPEAVEKDGRESAYYDAYRMGLLRPAERNDNAVLTRADVVNMLLNAAGYGPAARLGGIYTCDYADKDAIPAEELGYAAMAQALGLASGVYAGSRAASRGEAASMLCRVLERGA